MLADFGAVVHQLHAADDRGIADVDVDAGHTVRVVHEGGLDHIVGSALLLTLQLLPAAVPADAAGKLQIHLAGCKSRLVPASLLALVDDCAPR